MPGPGATLINTAQIQALIDKINTATNTDDLEAYAQEALAPIENQIAWIRYYIELLAPLLALLNPPTIDPAKIVTWITEFITAQIAPQVEAYGHYVEQLATITAKLDEVRAAANNARQRIEHLASQIPSV
jgi:hypothetical protein